jgi:sensor histidine kinase YesM
MKWPRVKAGRTTRILMQVLLWAVFYLMLLLYTTHKWENTTYGVLNGTISTVFYLLAAYGNASWLMPSFLQKGKMTAYLLVSVCFIVALIGCRMQLEYAILMPLHKNFYGLSWAHFSFDTITSLIAFLFGALIRVALNYSALLKQKEELVSRQVAAELNLLKAQVQPHFLFNTLNNIYSLAQSGSKQTPDMIAKLSELMRYFIDDSPKDKIPLTTELEFINNYLELEQIRMLHPLQVNIQVDGNISDVKIAPMLLMPFIENVFKHGVDKTERTNLLEADLCVKDGKLNYKVVNTLHGENGTCISKGFGLVNLRKRLELLYPGMFKLNTEKRDHRFVAELQIPVQ